MFQNLSRIVRYAYQKIKNHYHSRSHLPSCHGELKKQQQKNGIKSDISRGAILWDQLVSKERLCPKTKGWHNFMNTTTKNPSPLFLEQQLISKHLCISRENIVWDSWLIEVLVRNIFSTFFPWETNFNLVMTAHCQL